MYYLYNTDIIIKLYEPFGTFVLVFLLHPYSVLKFRANEKKTWMEKAVFVCKIIMFFLPLF